MDLDRSVAGVIAARHKHIVGSVLRDSIRDMAVIDSTVGTDLAPNTGTSVYAISWEVRQASLGQHSLKAVATDTAGNPPRPP